MRLSCRIAMYIKSGWKKLRPLAVKSMGYDDTTVPAHLVGLVNDLQHKRIENPPAPWKKVETYAIGGLEAIGYAPDSDLLLVVSSQGRGVFDCIKGEKIARDREAYPYDYIDETRLLATGIGPLAGQQIRIAGMYGGGLPTATNDGWGLFVLHLPWPHHHIYLTTPFKGIYSGAENAVKVGSESGYCACGFSETGLSFVIACSSDITIFTRGVGEIAA